MGDLLAGAEDINENSTNNDNHLSQMVIEETSKFSIVVKCKMRCKKAVLELLLHKTTKL